MSDILHDMVNLFYPHHCMLCEKMLIESERHICIDCLCDLPKTNYHANKGNPARALFSGYTQVNEVTAFLYFEKEGKTQTLIHALKYKGDKELAEYLGRIAASELYDYGFYASIETIIPISLHQKKQKKRGYNQSALIAKGISSIYGCEVNSTIVKRVTDTKSQTRKSIFDRHVNVEKIFEVTDIERLYGKHILLIDDVITTGATISSCIDALLSVPDIKISIFSLSIAREY
jgi:Predicted amidophosphoribosyltransferases